MGPKRCGEPGEREAGDQRWQFQRVEGGPYDRALVAHDVLTSSSSYFIYGSCTVFLWCFKILLGEKQQWNKRD